MYVGAQKILLPLGWPLATKATLRPVDFGGGGTGGGGGGVTNDSFETYDIYYYNVIDLNPHEWRMVIT